MSGSEARPKLNPLQLRTLVLLQELADDPDHGSDAGNGARAIIGLPHAHGDHVHVGRFTVPARFASGLRNESVLTALTRKGLLSRDGMGFLTLLPEGRAYETGLREHLLVESDH